MPCTKTSHGLLGSTLTLVFVTSACNVFDDEPSPEIPSDTDGVSDNEVCVMEQTNLNCEYPYVPLFTFDGGTANILTVDDPAAQAGVGPQAQVLSVGASADYLANYVFQNSRCPEGGVEEFMSAGLEYAPGQIILCDAGHSTHRLQKIVDALEEMNGTHQKDQLEKSWQVTHAAVEASPAPLIGADQGQREAALDCYLPAPEVEHGRPAPPRLAGCTAPLRPMSKPARASTAFAVVPHEFGWANGPSDVPRTPRIRGWLWGEEQ